VLNTLEEVAMAKRKPKRPYRLIGFKAYFDGDQAIINWWESMDEGSRSNAMRDLIHEALGLKPQCRKTAVPDLTDLQQDTRYIRQTLDEMPNYLERLVAQAASIQPVAFFTNLRATAAAPPKIK
jgi:hypothetical protein